MVCNRRSFAFFITAALFLLPVTPLPALEFRRTTADLVRLSPRIAHVRVVGSYRADGDLRGFHDYTLRVLSRFKGSLPDTFMVRMPEYPGSEPFAAGAELVVFVGDDAGRGLYTLMSHETGAMRVVFDGQGGARYLHAPVTGAGYDGRWSLKRFENYVRKGGL